MATTHLIPSGERSHLQIYLNGQLRGYSPLSRLLEIEGLLAAIEAKRSLWSSLRPVLRVVPIPDIDVHDLIDRADTQQRRLQPHHDTAAALAFAAPAIAAR